MYKLVVILHHLYHSKIVISVFCIPLTLTNHLKTFLYGSSIESTLLFASR